jgi:DNA-binding GntR family transcriptional regulator
MGGDEPMTEQPEQIVDGQPIVDRVVGEIANAIMLGDFPLGSWLRQEHLAQRFGVSRQPVREALNRLQVIGMIEAVPHRGARVTGPDPQYFREGYLIRAELEGLAARLAASRIDAEQLAELRAAMEDFRRNFTRDFEHDGDAPEARDSWVASHNRLHEVVHEASGSDRLMNLIRALNVSLPRNLALEATASRSQLEEVIDQHDLIVRAIEMRAARAADEAMVTHVLRSGEMIVEYFEGRRRDLSTA